MSNWISISESQPRNGQGVQITDGRDVGVWRYRGFWPDNNWHYCSGSSGSRQTLMSVTHWMPLAAPPGE